MFTVLVAGATGMLGSQVIIEARSRGFDVCGVARADADFNIDLTDQSLLRKVLTDVKPDLIINCAALISIEQCEKAPQLAFDINVGIAQSLCSAATESGAKLVHISTDHFFDGGAASKHSEQTPVILLNEYARTKYAAENVIKKLCASALILRTNIVGYAGLRDRSTFGRWVVRSLVDRLPLVVFENVFHSPIHTTCFSSYLFDLVEKDACGIVNVASSQVVSKAEFIRSVAIALNIKFDWSESGNVEDLVVPRPKAMGLDVSKVENMLGVEMPRPSVAAEKIVAEYQKSKILGAN